VLVGPVDRVARLESGDAAPPSRGDLLAQPAGRQSSGSERPVCRKRKDANRSGRQASGAREEVADPGMRRIGGSIDPERLRQRIAREQFRDLDRAPQPAAHVVERSFGTGSDFGAVLLPDGKRDRNRPRRPVGQAHPLDHAPVIRRPQESGQRAEGARGDQVAVISGINPGDEVVTSGVFKLRNGAAVQVNNKVQPGNSPTPKPEDS